MRGGVRIQLKICCLGWAARRTKGSSDSKCDDNMSQTAESLGDFSKESKNQSQKQVHETTVSSAVVPLI